MLECGVLFPVVAVLLVVASTLLAVSTKTSSCACVVDASPRFFFFDPLSSFSACRFFVDAG